MAVLRASAFLTYISGCAVALYGCAAGNAQVAAPGEVSRAGPALAAGDSAATQLSAGGAPKVILIIGDGMDDQQITIARNYLVGADGRLTLDGMPFRAAVQVQAVKEESPEEFVYVSDSANTATSIATGILTSRGRIATTPGTDVDVTTILERAQAAGMRTGIVTTASVTDATPASFVAHINQRFCQGPRGMRSTLRNLGIDVDCSVDYRSRGGLGSIAEQIAASTVDVVLGGGTVYFDQPAEGSLETVSELAEAAGFRIVRRWNEIQETGPDERVLGLFARNTMPVRWRGENDAEAARIERSSEGAVVLPEPFVCEPEPRFDGMPELSEMTRFALDRVDSERGFFLMVESASIDKQSHDRKPCGHIGELQQLDEAVAVALEYAAVHPETLILVTADHSHAAQLVTEVGGNATPSFATPGYFARLRTADGATMGVNYATNDSTQEYHTGSQVPLFAAGQAPGTIPSFIAQREIFGIMIGHLGLD